MYIYNFCVFFFIVVSFFYSGDPDLFLIALVSLLFFHLFCMFVCFVLEKRPLMRQLKCLVSYADESLVYLFK